MLFKPWLLVAALFALAINVIAWESDDHEIFDLVSALEAAEGKGTTFYTFLNITKSATPAEINRASRRRSLELHPDKNPGVKNIADRFARLGAITAILRDAKKRKRYDFFHDNGVPKWKGTGYVYSRWQPGVGFALSFIFLVVTLAQYVIQHANYRCELGRIARFQRAARQAAYGLRATATSSAPQASTMAAVSKSRFPGRKKVKVPIGVGNAEEGSDEEDAPSGRSRARRRAGGLKQGQTGLVTMLVEGEKVWILTEEGDQLPLDASAAIPPSFGNTFIPSLVRRLFACMLSLKPQQSAATDVLTGDESGADSGAEGVAVENGTSSAVGEKAKGAKRRKPVKGKK